MAHKFHVVVGAALLAAAMWVWVQDIAIPYQQAESQVRGLPRGNLSDLYPRWLGARELLLRRRDPYSADITGEIQSGYYGRPIDPARPNDPKDQQAFAYPLYVVFLLAPTVELPFRLVQRGLFWLLVIVTAWSVVWWLRALGWRISCTAMFVWIVLTLGCFPAIQGFKLQQLTLLVAALVAGAMSALAGGYLFLAGVLLAVASIKPQLVALPAVALGLWSVGDWRKRQRLVWGFALAMLALIGASELLLPGWISEFRRASAEYWRYTGGGRSVMDVELGAAAGRIVSSLLVLILAYWSWRLRASEVRSTGFAWLLALVMATTLAVIPMFAPYNQVLLVPALMVIVRAIERLRAAGRSSRLLFAATALAVVWPWLAAAALASALLFLPASEVQKAWIAPLATNFAIPTVTLGSLLVSGRALRSDSLASRA